MPAHSGDKARKTGRFHCERCGGTVDVDEGDTIPKCPECGNDTFDSRTNEPSNKG